MKSEVILHKFCLHREQEGEKLEHEVAIKGEDMPKGRGKEEHILQQYYLNSNFNWNRGGKDGIPDTFHQQHQSF